jgi:hypothetical protein
MPRSCLTIVLLLAFFAAATGLAWAADDIKFEPLPFVDQSSPAPPSRTPGPAGETPIGSDAPPTSKSIDLNG